MANAIPGGGKWPASKIGKDGRFARADLHMGVATGRTSCAVSGERERERMSKATAMIGMHEHHGPSDTRAVDGSLHYAEGQGTSIFDPVLCELAYRWFCPPDGTILDPFSGGSVRGIVAAKLGRQYVGIDLSARQIEANREQAARITPDNQPTWVVGDSTNIGALAPGAYDLVFSCPPYADLEVYSDNPADLSTMEYPAFRDAYRKIIAAACAMLKPDRFACFVVGDVRGPDGSYYGFVPDTIAAFVDAGLVFYNEAILVTALGSLPIRVGKQFVASRKLGKTHQNVLVFVKGDPKKAVAAIGEIELPDLGTE